VKKRWRIGDLRAGMDQLTEHLKARRSEITTLMPCVAERRWPVPWPAAAAALLDDPEAALDLAEALPAETGA